MIGTRVQCLLCPANVIGSVIYVQQIMSIDSLAFQDDMAQVGILNVVLAMDQRQLLSIAVEDFYAWQKVSFQVWNKILFSIHQQW